MVCICCSFVRLFLSLSHSHPFFLHMDESVFVHICLCFSPFFSFIYLSIYPFLSHFLLPSYPSSSLTVFSFFPLFHYYYFVAESADLPLTTFLFKFLSPSISPLIYPYVSLFPPFPSIYLSIFPSVSLLLFTC